MKIVIGFKNGKDIEISCEEFNVRTDYENKITGYTIDKIKDNIPLFMNMKEISYIIQKKEGDNDESNKIK